jgi:light-regulated signal transduction histidine kinase (bacteriophytochrome)
MSSQFRIDYAATLRAYLQDADESALEAAYELGRTAMANGTGVIDIVDAHAEAQRSVLGASQTAAWARSISFLVECLAPLEMAHGGFMATNRTLQRLNADLERSNRDLQSFATSIAHDLRTPLRALAGYSAALMEDCADGLGDAGRDYAERIEAASEHMGQVLDDLLQLSALGQAGFIMQRVDLGAEVASIAAELQRESPGRRVRFTIQRPAWVLADRPLIRAALRNLLDNAWKFTSRTDDALIEFGTMPAGDARVCCYVRDNGAGFDPAYVDKLFTPFQRLHTTREFPGTGIGLASVRQIVDRHGGRAWAQGAVGEGATFYFTLAAGEAITSAPSVARADPTDLERPSI